MKTIINLITRYYTHFYADVNIKKDEIMKFLKKFKDIEGVFIECRYDCKKGLHYYVISLNVPYVKEKNPDREKRVATKQEEEFIKNQLELINKILPEFKQPKAYGVANSSVKYI